MATTTAPPGPSTVRRAPMDPLRKTSLPAGVLYLITFVSIPTFLLYGPVKSLNYITGSGPDTGALLGGVFELIVAVACIGAGIALIAVRLIAGWESSLGVYLVAKGFRPSGLARLNAAPAVAGIQPHDQKERSTWSCNPSPTPPA